MTKIAFGCDSLAHLQERLTARAATEGLAYLTTRYLPTRHADMAGGSLYWIIAHRIVGRSALRGFAPAPDGRTQILIEPRARPVISVPRRAHQGWRYLTEADAPADIGEADALAALPGSLLSELTRLGLV